LSEILLGIVEEESLRLGLILNKS